VSAAVTVDGNVKSSFHMLFAGSFRFPYCTYNASGKLREFYGNPPSRASGNTVHLRLFRNNTQ
jgi:hypothetical protein